jgi:hypothetical protein
MLRPKRELTDVAKQIGARSNSAIKVTESEYDEWVKLGKAKWLRSNVERQQISKEKRDASV